MSYAAKIKIRQNSHRTKNPAKLFRAQKKSPGFFRLATAGVLSAVLVIAAVYHMANLNAMSIKGHEISRLQAQIHDLATAERDLLVKLGDGGSLSDVQDFASAQGFVPQGTVQFVSANQPTHTLAKR